VPARQPAHKVAEATRLRDARAVELYSTGMSWQMVADTIGLKTASAARRAALRSLDRVENESAEQMRRFEAAHLDRLQRVLLGKLNTASTRDTVAIANSLINLSARRSRMLGLDRPFELEVSKGASEAEFAVVAEALLQRAGREVPRQIAASAADARRQGFLPPATLAEATAETPVVVDAEIIDEPEPMPDATAAPVADPVVSEAVESLDTAALVGIPAWTDDGEIIAPFAVDDSDDAGEPEPDEVPEIADAEPSARPVAVVRPQPEPEPRVRIDGWELRPEHPLVARPTFQSGIDSRRLA
jgi:hypothetical protein